MATRKSPSPRRKRTGAAKKHSATRAPAAPTPPKPQDSKQPAAWGLLVYLAGDTDTGHEAVRDDLLEILSVGSSRDLQIVVQYDGPEGAARYIVPQGPAPDHTPVQHLGRLDSGSTATLLDFLQWGLSVCHAERIALVLGSPLVVSPSDAERNPDRVSVFSLSHDSGSGNYLDVCDMAGTIREALRDAGRERFDLVAIDSCHVQFLELAYELEDVVRILIAPQTEIPMEGWDYAKVLSQWHELAGARPQIGTADLASALLDRIIECYRRGTVEFSVSALDLQRLDEVANAFDTLCIGTLQALGEGLIWATRGLLLSKMKETSDVPVYDGGSFFALWSESLTVMADEAHQGWLGKTLERASGSKLDRFCEAVARHLDASVEAAGRRGDQVGAAVADRLGRIVLALRAPSPRDGGSHVLEHLAEGVRRRIELMGPGASAEARAAEKEAALLREALVQAAVA